MENESVKLDLDDETLAQRVKDHCHAWESTQGDWADEAKDSYGMVAGHQWSEDDQQKMEVRRFFRKYIDNDDGFKVFLSHLSPISMTKIVKGALLLGMDFTWSDEKEEAA